MSHELTLRIVLEQPPPGVLFGLQKGQGTNYETIQKRQSKGNDLVFEFAVEVKAPRKSASLDFRGPFVQGRRGARFVYIDIGTYAGQTDTPWSRRLKVPLNGITRHMLSGATPGPRGVLEARMPGTGRDGGPNCATVKPFTGWMWKR